MDSACTAHMTGSSEHLDGVVESDCSGIVVGNGEVLPVLGQGKVQVQTAHRLVEFQDVQYAPGLKVNLVSVKQLDKKGMWTLTSSGRILVLLTSGEVIMTATLRHVPGMPDELYILDGTPVEQTGAIGYTL